MRYPDKFMPSLIRLARRYGPPLVLALLVAGCEENPGGAGTAGPAVAPVVMVVKAQMRPISEGAEFVGRVEAMERVDIRARVTGFLTERVFTEGQKVAAGDLLFRIEPEPFEAAVAARQAQLEGAQASLNNSDLQVARGQELFRTNNLPRATLDQRIADQQIAAAQVSAAKAALDQANIQLGYTRITSPITGRVGRSAVTVGNVVGPDSGILTTVVKDDVVKILFPVSQRLLIDLKRDTAKNGERPLQIRIRLPDGTLYDQPGRLSFINVTADASTDSTLVQAEVPNADGLLTAGQVVGVRVEEEKGKDVLVIPQSALQLDQAGTFVLVVGADNKVEQTFVKVGTARGGQAVITEGLSPGALVITEGAQRVRPGLPVTPKPAPAPLDGPVKG
ncbi:membrane fusion protein (multidrug efflux system) [Aquabacter spiritensis]|uniref:Membrane fusion protein (Multidrug efflux system) n=2 Tax=Aquabacter spiritensis TaxID=933073 RepID=A0A4V2UXR5_9HYPH|nr:membrane fusion protein (multidrug efflux system) [Aquabacter spiritensis]